MLTPASRALRTPASQAERLFVQSHSEIQINPVKPVWNARLRATARVVKQGQTVGFVECDVTDDTDKLVARATSTCLTLRGEQAQGR